MKKVVEKRNDFYFLHDKSSVDTEIFIIDYREIAPESSSNCYDHYRKLAKNAAKIASAELGYQIVVADICFDGEYPCYKIIVNPEGFTEKEYTDLTRERVPNQWHDNLISLNDEGKVCSYKQQGNISAMISGHSFVKKGDLITEVRTEIHVRISVVGQAEYYQKK